MADSLIGWIYGIAAIGLFLSVSWGNKLGWIPASIFIYHSINYWFRNLNRNRDGNKLVSNSVRIAWSLTNFVTGLLTIFVAWNAS